MYTIEDLRGKYVKSGTKEAEVFFDACTKLGAEHAPRIANGYKFVELIYHDNGKLILSGLGMEPSAVSTSTPFTINPDWSIYTNTLPLCELTDEQAAAMFNAWRSGEVLQKLGNAGWYDSSNHELLLRDTVCRIKQKSERELFIDAAMQLMTSEKERTLEQQFGALFDSGKFKLVKDGE